jgi:hypothetical protein
MASARPTGYRPIASLTRTTSAGSEADEHVPFVLPANDLLTVIGRDGCFKRLTPIFPPAFGYASRH